MEQNCTVNYTVNYSGKQFKFYIGQKWYFIFCFSVIAIIMPPIQRPPVANIIVYAETRQT